MGRPGIGSNGPPPAFTRDLLARAICHRLQEQTFGGLSASTDRLLRSLVSPGVEPPRRIKAGSILMVPRFDGHGGYAASLSACSGVL